MPDLEAFFRAAPMAEFTGTVYRVCPARYEGSLVSMRGALLHGARYSIRGYFGALYTSLSADTARRETARYFTVAPIGGFRVASIGLRLSRVVNLTDPKVLRIAKLDRTQLTEPRFAATQEIGLRAWENGVEALLVPSAADTAESNLAVLLDNQRPRWSVELVAVESVE